MHQTIYKGVISFINHDKGYATIDFLENEKKKTINFKTGSTPGQIQDKLSKKPKRHAFRTGDHVSFHLSPSGTTSHKSAQDVKFLYNHELDKLIHLSRTENKFKGFLKLVDDRLFVKELNSYLFFPLELSAWEIPPPEKLFNEAFDFMLSDTDRPDKMRAVLYKREFIPAYHQALQYQKKQAPVPAIVSKISPYAIYLHLFGNTMQAKLDRKAGDLEQLKPGDQLSLIIKYLSPSKIVVERA